MNCPFRESQGINMYIMKHLLTILLIIFLGIFTSCSSDSPKDEAGKPDAGVPPVIDVPTGAEDYFSKNMDFDYSSSEKVLAFSSNVPWTIKVADTRDGSQWCTVTPTNGIAGTSSVIVKVSENTTYDDRNAVITLTAGSVTRSVFVNQKQRQALMLTSDRFEVPVAGGTINMEVKANIEYEVKIADDSKDWIHLSSTRSLSSSIVSLTIDKSDEYEKREGHVIVKGNGIEETATIYQAGEGILTLSKSLFEISCEKQELTIDISSNFEYAINMPNVDWIEEVKGGTRGISTHTLKLSISENTDYSERSAKIRVYDTKSSLSEDIQIVQAQKEGMIIDKHEYEIDENGGMFSVNVQSNINYDVSIDCDWIKEVTTRSLSTRTHNFEVSTISDNQDRQAKITFTSKSSGKSDVIVVKQTCGMFLDTNSLTLMKGEQKKLNLTNKTNQSVKWASSNTSVVTVDNSGLVTAVGKGDATVTVSTEDGKHSCVCDVSVKDISDMISASSIGGAISSINNLIQYGSKLNWRFSNNSPVSVTLVSMQLIDGETGKEGNIMSVNTTVDGGTSVSYSTTIGLAGIHAPVTCRFRYEYNGEEYSTDAVYTNNWGW